MSEKIQDTVISTLTDNLVENFFDGGVSSTNIITPDNDKESDDKVEEDSKQGKKPDQDFKHPLTDISTEELIGDLLTTDDVTEEEPEEKRGPGRPKKTETETPSDFNSLLEDGVLLPFEDDEPIKNFDDLKELIKANKAEERRLGKEEAIKSYKEALPEHVNLILDYVENGGQDFDNFLKALGQVQHVADLSLEKSNDQKEIIRQYYSLQDWAPEEINEHIEELLDLGEEKIAQVASKLKPKLDKMKDEALNFQLEEQKKIKAQQEEAQRAYVSNVTNSLKKGSLGDIKISKEEQKDIYSALIEERYQSVSGGTTNRLGALLDKIQFVEPDYDLLSKITLYISDPKKFEEKLKDQIKREVTADTVKKIKSEQGLNKNGTTIESPRSGSKIKRLDSTFTNPFAH